MAYDRYENRRGRDPDYDRNRREDRGFFERAGDEIASWFGDEDAERRRRDDERMGRHWERERGYARDHDRGFYPEHGYLRSEYDPDYDERGGYRPMNWTVSDRDYRRGWRGPGAYGGYDRGYDDGDRALGNENSGTGWRYGSNYGPGGYGNDYGRGTDIGRRGIGVAGEGTRFTSSRWREVEHGPSDRRDEFGQTSYAGSGRDYDRHYHAWRQRHLDELDRDYDDYRHENQARFENDFGSWREQRMHKRGLLGQIREHTEVIGSDGEHLGTVDCVRGDRVILTKSDSPDDRHHSIPCTMLDRVDGDKVILDVKAQDAKSRWRDEERDRALFEREGQGEAGPHNLDRSFAGTYDNR